jgi:N6-L-threonylcarbamoyladenine synthase
VAANSLLRERTIDACIADGLRPFVPSRSMCTDNAAMVALLGERRLSAGVFSGPELSAYAASRFTR